MTWCLRILEICAHGIRQCGHKKNRLSSGEITGMMSKNFTSEILYGDLYIEDKLYKFLWLGIGSNLVDGEFCNEHDNSGGRM